MADYADGGLAEEVVRVCEYYLGVPERREGERGTSEERAVWRCPECGGDYVARTGSAGCVESGCAVPRKENALGIVALHEGIDRRKDPRRLLIKCREVVEARRAAEVAEAEDGRTARAETRTDGKAGVEDGAHAQPSGVPGSKVDGPDPAVEQNRRRAVRAAERAKELRKQEKHRRWIREKEREEREELERKAAERDEALELEAARTSRRLQARAFAAVSWATPAELARAIAYGVAAALCVWVSLTVVEAAHAWLFGSGGADYEVVGHLTVGYGEVAPPQVSLWERCTEELQEHHRLLLAIATQVLFAVVLQWRWGSERRRRHAFGEKEYLTLRVVRKG